MMKKIYYLLFFFILTASAVDDARDANKAFEDGNYEEAIKLYQQAINQDPDNAKLHFNLAAALHEAGRSDDAMRAYDQFVRLSESPEEQSFANYNQGTMLTQQDKYDEAVDFFREALEKNPNDPDARHNYELALKKQQEQEQQQQQQNQDSGQNDDQQNQEQQQNQGGDNNQQEDQNQNQQQQSSGSEQEQQENEERQQPQPTEMTPEEAQNILDALKQLERQLLENMKKESGETPPTNEKDW